MASGVFGCWKPLKMKRRAVMQASLCRSNDSIEADARKPTVCQAFLGSDRDFSARFVDDGPSIPRPDPGTRNRMRNSLPPRERVLVCVIGLCRNDSVGSVVLAESLSARASLPARYGPKAGLLLVLQKNPPRNLGIGMEHLLSHG